MKRVPEISELIEKESHCEDYTSANRELLRFFFMLTLGNTFGISGKVADLGCGAADYDVEICRKYPDVIIDAYDGSESMIKIAKKITSNEPRIDVKNQLIENIIGRYDVVISANTLHHFHNPNVFWGTVKNISFPGTKVFVMDLVRPETQDKLDMLVNTCTVNHSEGFKKDFRDSLLASFTEDEIKEQLLQNNLNLSVKIHRHDLDVAIIHGVVQ